MNVRDAFSALRRELTHFEASITDFEESIENEMTRGNNARRLLAHVDSMREAQRNYFTNRTQGNLAAAKRLEATVDHGLQELRRKV